MEHGTPATSCPACGGSRILPIVWGWQFLDPYKKVDAEAGRVILGSRHKFGIRVGRPIPPQYPNVLGVPEWACLDCEPGWAEVHRLALEEEEARDAKTAAIESGDFEAARTALSRQDQLNDRIIERVHDLASPHWPSSRWLTGRRRFSWGTPRVRFTVKQLMIAVAVVGLLLVMLVPRPTCPSITIRVFNKATGSIVGVRYKWTRFASPDEPGTATLAPGEVKSFGTSYCNDAEFDFTWMTPNGRQNGNVTFGTRGTSPTSFDVQITDLGVEPLY